MDKLQERVDELYSKIYILGMLHDDLKACITDTKKEIESLKKGGQL